MRYRIALAVSALAATGLLAGCGEDKAADAGDNPTETPASTPADAPEPDHGRRAHRRRHRLQRRRRLVPHQCRRRRRSGRLQPLRTGEPEGHRRHPGGPRRLRVCAAARPRRPRSTATSWSRSSATTPTRPPPPRRTTTSPAGSHTARRGPRGWRSTARRSRGR
ncbi:hypothetical protein [Nocardioides convexus]|uniref:hypothetical protein n=1 Tax=Nocardioides convexus TaxID=2712224 RepID=UPI002418402C|nr:hypothetical protein [Nocardioides convexus]